MMESIQHESSVARVPIAGPTPWKTVPTPTEEWWGSPEQRAMLWAQYVKLRLWWLQRHREALESIRSLWRRHGRPPSDVETADVIKGRG